MVAKRKTGTILDYVGSPTGADVTEAFHPGWREADTEKGVIFVAPWEDPYAGFPEHGRRLARAIDSAGLPVQLRSLDPSMQWEARFEYGGADAVKMSGQYTDLFTRRIKHSLVQIIHVVPDDERLQRLVSHRYMDPDQVAFVNRYTILSTVWERDKISDDAARCLRAVGRVWVANRRNKRMLVSCGVPEDHIDVIPIPVMADDPLRELRGQPRMKGPVRFYHIGKWEPRKAHHELLGAYLMAMKPGEAKLYFKTSQKAPKYEDYPEGPGESLALWLADDRVKRMGWTEENVYQDLLLMRKHLTAQQIRGLHRAGDIYLSLSRGEGFDMPAFDSQIAGNRLVYTPSGGPEDFAGPDAVRVPTSGLMPCHPWYKWPGAAYAAWDEEVAAKHIRCAWLALRKRLPFRPASLHDFEAPLVGRRMIESIERLVQENQAS